MNQWRQALINELAAMFACEGCPHPYSWNHVEDRIEPLTKEETAAVLAEADALNKQGEALG